ncbi:MAG: hypothetical protein JST80_11865 [Bdellovibrionales bacterium]|nr:hypothetical protein [Bdellovibrionales bacterium]
MRVLSQSILNAGSSLLGICFVLVSYMKRSGMAHDTLLDEFLLVPIVAFFCACIFSYMALRSQGHEKSVKFEKIGDASFVVGLSSVAFISIIFTLEIFR